MCAIISYAVPMTDSFGRIYAGGSSIAQSKCEQHGWMFQAGELMWEGRLCPIGQIEEATKKAVEEIQRAKGEPRSISLL